MPRVYPNPDGTFFDGVPAIEQDVSDEDAEWMTRNGVFLLAPPAPAPAPPEPEPEPA